MSEPLKVSYSRANAFKSCPEYFRRKYVTQEHEDANEYALAGILFHNAVELDGNHHDAALLEAAIRHKGKLRGPEIIDRALSFLPAFTAFVEQDPYSADVVAREYEMKVLWDDPESGDSYRLHGFADRICRGKNGLVVDDWKTGKARPSDVAQLQTYAPIVARALGERVSLLRLIYLTKSGSFKVKSFKPTMEYDSVIDYLTDMGQLLYGARDEDGTRVARYPAWGGTTGHCRVCPFQASCPWVGLSSTDAI